MQSIFKDTDYNNSNGMQTSIWGPNLWFVLHTISFNYPVKPTNIEKKHYENFIMSLQHVLPCIYCRDNFKANLAKVKFSPSVMRNRSTFSKFIYDLHNCVNIMLNKTEYITYEEVRDRYENFRSRCSREEVDKVAKIQFKNIKEKECSESLYGKKSKTIIQIVPKTSKKKGFVLNSKCKTIGKSKK